MSYRKLNDFTDDLSTAATAAAAATQIINDPALPQIIGDVARLRQLTVDNSTGNSATAEPGIGLSSAVYPLHLYVLYRENPILYGTLALSLLIGLPIFIGYTLGKRR